ncbi:MAG: ATP-binding cassette domain-containing protein, partial [Mucinivorans sp.]
PMKPQDVSRIGYLPEERGLYKKMKVGEQALYLSRLKGLSRAEALSSLQWWFRKFDILGWWDKKVEELSKGMAQKVQFIVTVIHHPELLIFDEPFSGFDPINANLLKDEILELSRNGATVIFSTHNMDSVEQTCEYITLINKSRNILSGRVDDIRSSMGTNTFRLDFRGHEADLKAELATLCAFEPLESVGEMQSVLLSLPVCTPSKVILAKANEVVDIHNFYEQRPSMNEIFIKTVNEWNKNE